SYPSLYTFFLFLMLHRPLIPTLFPYTTLFRSNPDAERAETDPRKLYHNAHVYAKDITFHPVGRQEEYFVGDDAIQPVNPDILIADRKSTRLNSSHVSISYAVFCLKKKKNHFNQ